MGRDVRLQTSRCPPPYSPALAASGRILPFCGMAGLAALLIAWVTVAGNTWRGARVNPIYSLRYE